MLGPDNDATWRDVNLAAVAPWPRLRAAQAWIDLNAAAPNASLDAFRAVAKTLGAWPTEVRARRIPIGSTTV